MQLELFFLVRLTIQEVLEYLQALIELWVTFEFVLDAFPPAFSSAPILSTQFVKNPTAVEEEKKYCG